MKFCQNFSLTVLALIIASCQITEAVNFCNMPTCNGKQHIACLNDGAFGPACASNARIITMTPALKSLILKRHNVLRNRAAGDNQATRMATVVWNNDLTYLAKLNVKKCKLQFDPCHATANFSYPGQNLALTRWDSNTNTVATIVKKQINSWYASGSTNINSRAQMLLAGVTRIGCAILRQVKNGRNFQFMTCNYSIKPASSRQIQINGTKAGSECTTGTNPTYSNLCSDSEVYDLSTE